MVIKSFPYRAQLFALFLISSAAFAAPMPGTGSSLLVAPEMGLFWKRQGFQLKAGTTGWQLAAPQGEDDEQVRYLKPNSSTGSLAVRTEILKADLSLENYTKRWMKDYSNYGFEVLGTQPFFQNGSKGLVVDLLHKKSNQQLRQVLFVKNKKAVVLTCRDTQKFFSQTILSCNQISKSFEWTDNKPNSKIN
ncbi:MAG: hypothetical protein ACAH59_10070 [Pseudobdellovibrionaceae bacterium]